MPDTSYLSAALRGLATSSNMVAPDPPGPHSRDAVDANSTTVNVTLVSTVPTAHNTDQPANPYKVWNGDKSTLAPFLSELDITLSAHDSTLHTFAVEFYAMLTNGKTVLAFPGQAAQLDGAINRPIYDWDNPAPEAGDAYGVDHITVTETIHANYNESRLRNPALPADLPVVPMGTPYPVD
jgi:hypothetical protein